MPEIDSKFKVAEENEKQDQTKRMMAVTIILKEFTLLNTLDMIKLCFIMYVMSFVCKIKIFICQPMSPHCLSFHLIKSQARRSRVKI